MFWRDQRGYSLTFWAVFIGLVLVPALALSIELGRYFAAIAEIQKAADAAATAAAAEIDPWIFQETGNLVLTAQAWTSAQVFVAANSQGLSARGVHAFVTAIQIDEPNDTVRVQVSANLSILFPSIVPQVLITRTGIAQIRALTH